ncbi:hypothetical protein Dsin_022090 [Dipteronia sinensis]|uniref:Uncharacterized protein n=1 Tax=Dipteronia sinensis TaxID=43782 RepID=A0AAE0A0V6_9ROSI|nr:hypothetical protein Dsin_022090 [Dipteronia sinensis]
MSGEREIRERKKEMSGEREERGERKRVCVCLGVEMSATQPNLVDIDFDSNNPLNTQSQAPSCDINLVDINDIECESGRQTSQANMRSIKRTPGFNGMSRNTLKSEVMKLYEVEKSRTMMILDETTDQIAFTTDMWTSNQKKGYMVVTTHFIDNTWKLCSRILIRLHPHTVEALMCTQNWIWAQRRGLVPEDEILRGEVMNEDDE